MATFDPWKDIHFPEADHYVVRTTGIYGNDLDLLILGAIPKEKIINPLSVLKVFRSKHSQYDWFESHDISILPWINLKGMGQLTIEKFFRLYPLCVVKPLIGQGGWGVEILSAQTFRTWKKKKGHDDSYLLQPLVKGAREYRYFFMKHREPLILERRATSGVAANFQKNGEASLLVLPEEIKQEMEKIVSLSGALYGAIDFFIDEGRPYVLELNSVPGFEQIEKISDEDLVGDFLKMIDLENE